MTKTLHTLAVAALFTGLLSVGVALAAGLGAPERGIPYVGALELNGAALTGMTTLAFSLHDDAAAGAELWSSGDVEIMVSGGRFAVVLGDGVGGALPDAVFDSRELYVSVGVEGTVLAGRQQIYAAAQAERSQRAYSLTLADNAGAGRIYNPSQNGVVLYTDTDNAGANTQSAFRVVANGDGTAGTEVEALRVTQAGDLNIPGEITWGGDNSGSGYIRLGDVQLMWGTRDFNITGNGTVSTVGFSPPFAVAPTVNLTIDDPGFGGATVNDAVGARAIGLSEFQILSKQDTQNLHLVKTQWMAIGRWR